MMNRMASVILLITLIAVLFATLFPPVDAMSYTSLNGVITGYHVNEYHFLFGKSSNKINFQRLALEYLEITAAAVFFLLLQSRISAFMARRAAENESKATDKVAKEKWLAHRGKLEQQIKIQTSELNITSKRLDEQTARRRQLEEELKVIREQFGQKLADNQIALKNQADELAILKAQLQEQKSASEKALWQIEEYDKQIEKNTELLLTNMRLQDEIRKCKKTESELKNSNERLQLEISQPHESQTEQSDATGQPKQPAIPIRLFDAKQMKALAKLARKLA